MINKVTLLGRVGKDVDVRNLENGTAVATFSLATSTNWKDKNTGEKKEKTEWHNLVVWRGLADIAAKYVHKGDLLYIEGSLATRSWEKDGVTRYTTEIVVSELKMLSKKDGGGSNQSSAGVSDGPKDDSEELPF